jgi:hypothetical protein
MGLCSPALVYLIFSLTQLFFDISNAQYNTAFMKLIVIISVTVLLQILCQRDHTTVAWLIVFIPFIFMSIIVGIMLYIFGLNPATGRINPLPPPGVTKDNNGNIVVYDPYYDPAHPTVYAYPNVIVPVPTSPQPPPPPPIPYISSSKTTSQPNPDPTTTTIPTKYDTSVIKVSGSANGVAYA